jgi:hypothetical protein
MYSVLERSALISQLMWSPFFMTTMSVFSLPKSGEGKKTAAQIRSDRIFIKSLRIADPCPTTPFYTWSLIFAFAAGRKERSHEFFRAEKQL